MRALSQETIMSRRLRAGSSFYAEPIPTIAQPMASQYGEPMEYARMMLSSYARYVCRTLPHQHDPNCRAKSVKIYRITHQIITPAELAEGHDVLDVRNLWAFFQGEFDTTGKLISPDDPFLYWRVPIVYVPKEWPNPNTPFRDDLPMEQMRLLDGVKLHAEYRSSDQKKSQ